MLSRGLNINMFASNNFIAISATKIEPRIYETTVTRLGVVFVSQKEDESV